MMSELELFLAALDVDDPASRQLFLMSSCGQDAELLRRVEALLTSHEGEKEFLNTPAVEQIASASNMGVVTTREFENDSTRDDDPEATTAFFVGAAAVTDAQETAEDAVPLGYLEPSSRGDSKGRLAHYEVLEVVGRGAFGTVLRAFDEKLHRVVAIKVMAPELASTSPARKRFLREAQASAAIRHEHVVSIHAVEEKPLPYLVMEYIPGQTLEQRLREGGPLDVLSVLRLGRQIAEGLAAAHAINLIHRDIKPGNILLETGVHDRVKITDFGLARAADDASLTQSGTIAGTPMYMAPEQALGKKLDQRADLFSVGSVLYQMVSGRPPFRAPSALAVLKRVAEETPRPIQEIIPETPDWLCGIIAKLHAKSPEDRFQSAREVADLLADCEAKLKAKQEVVNILPASKPAIPKWAAAAAILLLLVVALTIAEFAGVTHLTRQTGTQNSIKPGSDLAVVPRAQEETPAPNATQQQPPLAVATSAAAAAPQKGTPSTGGTAPAPPTVPASDGATAPFADADVQRIAALPAEQQIEEVRKELKRRNPKFDGTLTPTIKEGVVTELKVLTDEVTDLAPVRALRGLVSLSCGPTAGPGRRGKLADISPLQGLALTHLDLTSTMVAEIAVLQAMPLVSLSLDRTPVADLSPLAGKVMKTLHVGGTKVTSISDVPVARTEVLHCHLPQVSSKAELQRLGVRFLDLWGVPMTTAPERLRELQPPLSRVNGRPLEEFLKEVERK